MSQEEVISRETVGMYINNFPRRNLDHLGEISPICSNIRNRMLKKTFPRATEKDLSKHSDANEKAMDQNCKVTINIPTHIAERNLLRTLSEYAKQIDMDGNPLDASVFEINILINAKKSDKFNKALLTEQIEQFRRLYPNIRVNTYQHQYAGNNATISRIRDDLASISLIRALEVDCDMRFLSMVTNDADAIEIDSKYIARIIRNYETDSRLKIQIGGLEYPEKEYFSNHLFLATNRFMQFFETILRYKEDRFPMRGGNSVIKADAYAEAGGYNPKKLKRENLKLYRHVRNTYGLEGIHVDSRMKITTNARRATYAIESGCLAKQHVDFGKAGDFSERYLVSEDELTLPEGEVKITNPKFDKFLRGQIKSLYQKYRSDMRYIKIRAQKDPSLWNRVDQETKNLNRYFKRAAFFLGINIEFISTSDPYSYDIEIIDIKKAKSLILKKYNHI